MIRRLDSELIPTAVDVHLEAFSGFMSARVGRRYATSFLEWFHLSPTGVGLAALSGDGRMEGYLVGARSDYESALWRHVLPWAALGLARRPWLLGDMELLRGAWVRLRSIAPAGHGDDGSVMPPNCMDLVAVGVARQSRGRGVGVRLVDEFERRACAMGMSRVRLSVLTDNVPARRLYEGRGWRIVAGSLEANRTSLVYAKSLG